MPNRIRYFTDEEQAKIKDLYIEQSWGLVKTARALHCSINALSRYLKSIEALRSIPQTYINRSKNMEKVVSEELRADIIATWTSGDGPTRPLMKDMQAKFAPLGQMVLVRVLMEGGIDVSSYSTPWSYSLEKLKATFK